MLFKFILPQKNYSNNCKGVEKVMYDIKINCKRQYALANIRLAFFLNIQKITTGNEINIQTFNKDMF